MEVFKRERSRHQMALEVAPLWCVSTPQARLVLTWPQVSLQATTWPAPGVERVAQPSPTLSSTPSPRVGWVRRMILTDTPRPSGSCTCELSPRARPSQQPRTYLLIGALRAAAQVPTCACSRSRSLCRVGLVFGRIRAFSPPYGQPPRSPHARTNPRARGPCPPGCSSPVPPKNPKVTKCATLLPAGSPTHRLRFEPLLPT